MGWFSRNKENLSILQDTEGDNNSETTTDSEPEKVDDGKEYVILEPIVEKAPVQQEQVRRNPEDYQAIGEQRVENAKQAVIGFKTNIAAKFQGLWQKAKSTYSAGKSAVAEAAVYAMSTPERVADKAEAAASYAAATPERVGDAMNDAYEGVASKGKELYAAGQAKVEAGVNIFNEKKEAVLNMAEEKMNALEARAVAAKNNMAARIEAAKQAYEQKMQDMEVKSLKKEFRTKLQQKQVIDQRLWDIHNKLLAIRGEAPDGGMETA